MHACLFICFYFVVEISEHYRIPKNYYLLKTLFYLSSSF